MLYVFGFLGAVGFTTADVHIKVEKFLNVRNRYKKNASLLEKKSNRLDSQVFMKNFFLRLQAFSFSEVSSLCCQALHYQSDVMIAKLSDS